MLLPPVDSSEEGTRCSTPSFSQPLLNDRHLSDQELQRVSDELSDTGSDDERIEREESATGHFGNNTSNRQPHENVNSRVRSILVSCKSFAVAIWRGPEHERDPSPNPIKCLRGIESLPNRMRVLISRPYRVLLLTLYMSVWVFIWYQAMVPYFTNAPTAEGVPVISLTCGQASDFWKGKNAACGINSRFCPTFGEDLDVIFRCPALCDRGSWLYSLRVVGSQNIKYRGFFIGGGEKHDDTSPNILSYPYRADSFPCGAAVHAGVVSRFFGGCARASYQSGPQNLFVSTPGKSGSSDSIGFESFFPTSYIFTRLPQLLGPCKDPRLVILVFNIFMGIPVVFFGSAAAFYWIMAIVGFWTISLATDPPIIVNPQDPETLYNLLSVSLERFLPTCFILYVLWVVSVKRTFLLKAPLENDTLNDLDEERPHCSKLFPNYSPLFRIIFWYLFFWIGVVNNMTFDRLPIDRLTLYDLQTMPGALIVMCVLGAIMLVCVVAQAYYLWLLGRLWKFFKAYALVSGILIFLSFLPGLTLRIHHYIFALLLIPGCSTKGWTAYVFQGLLLGLFLSGVARWGYASIAETNFSLLRGEPMGQILAPVVQSYDSGVLRWRRPDGSSYDTDLEDIDRYTEVSLLINDIERYRGMDVGSVNVTDIIEKNEHLGRLIEMAMGSRNDQTKDLTLFLRLARYSNKQRKYGDYTRASILKYPSLEWRPAPPGLT